MLGVRRAYAVVKAVQAYKEDADTPRSKPAEGSLLSKVAKSLGVNPALVGGATLAVAASAIGALVYALFTRKKEAVDEIADSVEQNSAVKDAAVGSGSSSKSLPASAQSATVPQVSTVPSAPRQASAPMSALPDHEGAVDVSGSLTIQEEARGNRKLVTNTVATKQGLDTASYGAFQMTGITLKDYIANSKYSASFKGLKPGSDAFTRAWAELTNGPKGEDFLKDQKSYLVDKLLKPYVVKPLKDKGISFNALPDNTKEFLFSAAVNTPKLARAQIQALPDNASASDLVVSISKARAERYAKNRVELRAGLFKRLFSEAEFAGVKLSLSDMPVDVQLAASQSSPQVAQANGQGPAATIDAPPLPPQNIFRTKSGILAVS